MSAIRDLVIIGEGDGHDLIGMYLLTQEESTDMWDNYDDPWEYINENDTSAFDTFADLQKAILTYGFVIENVWVCPAY